MRRILPLLLLATLLPAASLGAPEHPASVAVLLQTEENLAFLTAPERVEVCLLTLKEPIFRKKSGKHRYVEGPAKPLPSAAAERVRSRLASDDTYRWHTEATGEAAWDLRVKFHRGDHFLSADFSFETGLILFARDGLPFAAEDYVDLEDEFFALLRTPFPKDKALRAIATRLASRQQERAARNSAFERQASEAAKTP